MSVIGEAEARLARMANQIGTFFAAYPEEEAVTAIADHINQFWSRRMRADFREAFGDAGESLAPLVRRALAQVRA